MNIGIIGGADGPTSIFVAPSISLLLLGLGVLLIGGIVAFLLTK